MITILFVGIVVWVRPEMIAAIESHKGGECRIRLKDGAVLTEVTNCEDIVSQLGALK